ncbi:efflux RND transporter periplasmic adaptor subunit [Salinarimonas ramus]|uniref:MexE family multidrug efflux RND transporter periplasmic adaptor subunit n=1 Tax=Salinarimonas ramus TaxID=690164 RepID=A0A917Q9Z0_9HYPH|nr:efflux RND transporter periplasmic adaptor subunit [Salinarimonas ramus]GGK37559.1 MexE family multidrug efflux RND transporter periplasmic adaptor subunit [Salinarimonas ramus]
MNASRIASVAIIIGAVAWVASGQAVVTTILGEPKSAIAAAPEEAAPAAAPEEALFSVAVHRVGLVDHARTITLSGFTRADRRASAVTRTQGVVVELAVRRGTQVEKGDVVAVLSDEAREAQVIEARARLEQRIAEAEARMRLIENGTLPALQRPEIEADLKTAEAALAQAEAEADRGLVRAPLAGVVDAVPAELGQAMQVGEPVAEIIALDPMLAVVEIAERQLGGVNVGDRASVRLVTGQTASGEVRFVSNRASEGTRTYRVEIGIDNADGAIADGITAEATLALAAVPSAEIPRSALTFSSAGELGVRLVDAADTVAFAPVAIVEDGRETLWVSGLPDGAAVIVQGQDFVVEGQHVAPVPFAVAAARR